MDDDIERMDGSNAVQGENAGGDARDVAREETEGDGCMKKRSGGDDNVTNEEHKRQRLHKETQRDKSLAQPVATEDILKTVRDQIEYYLSDSNLSRDRFFHDRISAHPENWLSMELIEKCHKIRQLHVSRETILAALEDSPLETQIDQHNHVWVRRTTPLPPLSPSSQGVKASGEERANRKTPKTTCPTTVEDIHQLGCFLQLSDIPEEVSWVPVKKALQEALPAQASVRYVSTVSQNGTAYAYMRSFPDDVAYFTSSHTLHVNNHPIRIALVHDLDTVATIIKQLPSGIIQSRSKELCAIQAAKNSRPLVLSGTRFENVSHLRKCCKELIDITPSGECIKPSAFKTIRSLLEYHPNAKEKLRDIDTIKVDCRVDPPPKFGEHPPKCLFVVRNDGSCEDISVLKCIENMMRNPPYFTNDTPPPHCADTTEPEDPNALPTGTCLSSSIPSPTLESHPSTERPLNEKSP